MRGMALTLTLRLALVIGGAYALLAAGPMRSVPIQAESRINLLDPLFTEVGAISGTDDSGNDGYGVAWGDYDNDGDLDLYLANAGSANRLYQNNADGTFSDVGTASGTGSNGDGRGAAWGDYDNDGDLDLYLYLSNSSGGNRLYRNEGDGTFADVGVASGTDDGAYGHGVAWVDYDNDGNLDLYVANFDTANR